MPPAGRVLLGVFAAVLLGLAAGHARLLSSPVPRLAGIVPDDAFYYLQIARHLAAGEGSTFDGVHPASGYHPAWMALLVPLAAALPEPGSLLRGALALALLLHAAGAFALIGLFRRFTSPTLAVIGALCWLANPFALYLALLGVESALYVFSLVLVLRAAAAFIAAPDGLRSHFALGGALGLCFLARTEAGVLALVTCAAAPALAGRRPWSRAGLRSALRLGAVFTLCTLPWFAYCWLATGSPWQSSGAAKALWAARLLAPLGVSQRLAHLADTVGRLWLVAPWIGTAALPFEGTFVCAAMAPAAFGLLRAARRPREHFDLIAWSSWLLGSTVLTGIVYGLFYWDVPTWYRAQPALLLFVIAFLWIARAGAATARPWGPVFTAGVPLLLLILSVVSSWSLYRQPPVAYPWQRDYLGSQRAFERLVPPGEAIGCFNAGIPGFFSRRRIVNLDGLVNSSVLPYFRARDFDRYFADEGIRYIADDAGSVKDAQAFMRRPLRLRELAWVPLQGGFATRRWLWRVERPTGRSLPD
ncbi:MAG TPA: hypothetical protein VIC28_05875 [Thermoanaerobaculia bacterium]